MIPTTRYAESAGGLIASQVLALAGAGEVLVSRTVGDRVAGSGLPPADRGEHVLRGIPGTWQLLAVQ